MGLASELLAAREKVDPQGRTVSTTPIYRDVYDYTFGAAEYGAAETAGYLASGLNRFTGNRIDPLGQFALSMDRFKRDHPEFSPVQIESASELLTNPSALSSRVFGGAARMATGMGALAVPNVGVALAAGLAYTIDGQQAYEDAVAGGATQQQAENAAMTIGGASAILDTLSNMRVLSFARGKQGWFANKIASRAEKIMKAGGLLSDAAGMATTAAVYSMVQGAANEGLANITYGRQIDPGFFDRRMQEAIGAAASSVVFGLPAKGIHMAFAKPDGTTHQMELNIVDRDTFREYVIQEGGMTPEHATAYAEVVDAFARTWASENNQPVEKWYGTYVQPENASGAKLSDHLVADASQIPKIFMQKDPVKAIQDFLTVASNDLAPSVKETFAQYGIDNPQKTTELFTRYLQEGIAPSPELVQPFENYKALMKDVWNTTKNAVETPEPNKNVPDWVNEEMIRQGKNPNRMVNEVDAARPDYKKLVEKDPLYAYAQKAEPELATKMLSGEITQKEYQAALKRSQQSKPQDPIPTQLRSALDRVFSIDTDLIAEARQRLYKSEEELLRLKESEKTPERTAKQDALVKAGPDINKMLDDALDQQIRLVDARELHPKGSPEWIKIQSQLDQLQSEIDRLGGESLNSLKTDLYTRKGTKLEPSRDVPVVDLEKGISIKHIPGTLETQDSIVRAMYDDLRRLQLGRELPDRDSMVARRASESGYIREALRHIDPEARVVLNNWQHAVDWIHAAVDYGAPLKRYKSGQVALDALSDVIAHRRMLQGEWNDKNWEVAHNLDHRDKAWLKQETDTMIDAKNGYYVSNIRRFLDLTAVNDPIQEAPTESLRAYRDHSSKLMTYFWNLFRREGGMIHEPGEQPRPLGPAPELLRMLRFPTDEFRAAVISKEGPVYEAIRKAVQHLDPKADLAGADKILSEFIKEGGIRESGPLTDARSIAKMPSGVIVNGKRIQLFHEEPFEYLQRSTRTQAYQIGWNRVIGDKDLDQAHTSTMKKYVELLGLEAPYNVSTLAQRIKERGFDVPAAMMSDLKLLEKHAKQLDVPVGPKRKDYINTIDRLTVLDFESPGKQKVLRKFAEELGGIDPNLPAVNLLDEVKRRSREGSVNAIEKLKDAIRREGGSAEYFNNVVKLSQGIPIYLTQGKHDWERTIPGRTLNVVSGVVGTHQTSMATVANVPQTLVQVGHMAGVRNLLAAWDSALKNPAKSRDVLMVLGAIGDTHLAWGLERGYKAEGLTRNLRQAVQMLTGMKVIGDLNNIIAGEAFRRKALEWKADPKRVSKVDVEMLRGLEMTPDQIKEIQSGNMSDFTFAKIVQQGVAKTQYVSESAHRRGWLENHPLARVLFAYNSYAAGTMRSTIEFAREFKTAFQTGEGRLKMLSRLMVLTGGALGAGAMSEMARNMVRGDFSREQRDPDDVLHKGLAALMAVQLIGPAQRMLDSYRFDAGSPDAWITGLMPQVRAIGSLMALTANVVDKARGETPKYGRFAEFSALDQISETFKQQTPAAKAFFKWKEEIAYPNTPLYSEAKAAAGKWVGEHSDKPATHSQDPLNPEYYDVWQWTVRGDQQMAIKAAQQYYDDYVQRFRIDPEKAVQQGMNMNRARTGLRSSLSSRAPLGNMNPVMMATFLQSLPEDRREQYLQTHARYMALVNVVAPSSE